MTWIRALLVLVVLAVAAACSGKPTEKPSGTPPPQTTASASAATSAPAAPQVKVIEISVKGRSVSPPPGRVEVAKGEKVRLVVHSDAADEVHVHGYDLEAGMGPGRDAVIEFVASQQGLFEVETHKSGLVLTQLAVR